MTAEMTTYPDLPKWPGLLVTGTPVTRDRAAEILIRTNGTYMHTNDKAWEAQVEEAYGLDKIPTDEYGRRAWPAKAAIFDALGVIDLHYLTNARVASSWIGGPKGWLDWDGTVGCSNFNIGKWPTVEEVRDDWAVIAATWPFLDLRCQLLSGETCEEWTVPVVEFVVSGGTVRVVEPGAQIRLVTGLAGGAFSTRMFMPGGERGCTIETLRWALDVTRRAVDAGTGVTGSETVLWGHGYGSKRHVVDLGRPSDCTWSRGPRGSHLAVCSPADSASPARVSLDEYSDDDTPNPDNWSQVLGRGRTPAETVMRLKPCLRCCKKAGIDPATA